MEEVEKVSQALQLVERYEHYLFRKAWGVTFIIWGIFGPLTALLALKAQPIAEVLGMSAEVFILLTSTMIWLVGIAIVIYSFVSATIATSRERKVSFRREMPHALVISLIWFFSFNLTGFVPERFGAVSWLWAGGGASLLSDLILRKATGHGSYPELRLVGLILLIASFPIAGVSNLALAQIAALVTFSISFVSGGLYSITTASKVLNTTK